MNALYDWVNAGGRGEYAFHDDMHSNLEHTFCAYGLNWNLEYVSAGEFVCDNIYYSCDDNVNKHTLWIDIMPDLIRIDSTCFGLDEDYHIDPSFFSTQVTEEEIFQCMTAYNIYFLDAETLKIAVNLSKCL